VQKEGELFRSPGSSEATDKADAGLPCSLQAADGFGIVTPQESLKEVWQVGSHIAERAFPQPQLGSLRPQKWALLC
jgi:hypothetical protein